MHCHPTLGVPANILIFFINADWLGIPIVILWRSLLFIVCISIRCLIRLLVTFTGSTADPLADPPARQASEAGGLLLVAGGLGESPGTRDT